MQQGDMVAGRMDLSLSYDYEYFDHALNGTNEAPNPKDELTLFRTTQFRVGYAFNDRLRMNAWLPYRQITAPKTHDPGGPEEVRFTRRFSGLGDVIVMGYYQAVKPVARNRPTFTLGLGVRLPTGSSQPEYDWGTGISRDPVLQTGAGSLDPIMAGIVTLPVGRSLLFGNAVARLTTDENIHGYRYGDEYQAGFGVARPINTWLDMSIAANGIFTGHDFDSKKGSQVENTGGTWIYLAPAVTLRSGLINATMSLQMPLLQNVNKSQLVSDYIFSISLSCGLNTKKQAGGSASGFPFISGGAVSGHAVDIRTISLGESVAIADHVADGKYTIFEFYGDRCLACAEVEPKLRALVSSNPQVALRKINIGSGESAIVSQYEITETPTMIVLDRDGRQVLRYAGTTLDEIRRVIAR